MDPADFPPLKHMISSPSGLGKNSTMTLPTSDDMEVLSTEEAFSRWGRSASLAGHYYHMIGEMLMGLWRVYSSFDKNISETGSTSLASPSRIIFPLLGPTQWRDRPGLNSFTFRAAFPSISIEDSSDWEDKAHTNRLFIYDTAALTARSAAHRVNYKSTWYGKPSSATGALPGSSHWWEPIRHNVLEFVGLEKQANGLIERPSKPVITYISRQGRGRCLKEKDHDQLVESLQELERKHGWEVNIAQMERLPKNEQIRLAGRTTVIVACLNG
ncbi:hypothetical protein FRB99_007871 [Tulasnella sp. 403]|nr:hypothetical protein FRB99_007871 [Tulasnella sp. 403]